MMRVQCWLRTWLQKEAEEGGGGFQVTDKLAETQARLLTFRHGRGGMGVGGVKLALNEKNDRGDLVDGMKDEN